MPTMSEPTIFIDNYSNSDLCKCVGDNNLNSFLPTCLHNQIIRNADSIESSGQSAPRPKWNVSAEQQFAQDDQSERSFFSFDISDDEAATLALIEDASASSRHADYDIVVFCILVFMFYYMNWFIEFVVFVMILSAHLSTHCG